MDGMIRGRTTVVGFDRVDNSLLDGATGGEVEVFVSSYACRVDVVVGKKMMILRTVFVF